MSRHLAIVPQPERRTLVKQDMTLDEADWIVSALGSLYADERDEICVSVRVSVPAVD